MSRTCTAEQPLRTLGELTEAHSQNSQINSHKLHVVLAIVEMGQALQH